MGVLVNACSSYNSLGGAGDMTKHGFSLNLAFIETKIPSTLQAAFILGIMAILSVALIDRLYKKRGE